MELTETLIAIALEFARDTMSDIECEECFNDYYSVKANPAQLAIPDNIFTEDGFWQTPNLEQFTIVQLGMLADLQRAADNQWLLEDAAYHEKRIRDHEALIKETMTMGAGDRETAIRWLEGAA